MTKLSIVATLYYSEPYLLSFYRRITDSVSQITDDYEIVLVNDGSPDESLTQALALRDSDPKVMVVDLSRNFGHHKAIMAGLAHASGEQIFLIDCDLEEPPECLLEFYREFTSEKGSVDVVYGAQRSRKGGWFERVGGAIFYSFLDRFSSLSVKENPLTVRLMSRRFVKAVLLHQEEGLYLAGIFKVTGFHQKRLLIDKGNRGASSYTFGRRISLMLKGLTAFSSFPLQAIFYLGTFMSTASFLLGFYLIVRKLMFNDLIDAGWTSIMVSIWFIGGLLMLGIGMTGLYISKIFSEVKNRPNYIVRNVYKQSDNPESGCKSEDVP